MNKPASIRTQLKEILKTQRFDELSRFSDAKSWKGMRKPDKELLAKLFLMNGERQIQSGSRDVFLSLEKAQALAPKSADLWQEQGWMLIKHHREFNALPRACQAFQEAVSLDDQAFDSWFGWGQALLRSGEQHQESSDLHDAQEKFSEAFERLDETDERAAQLHWEWGRSCLRAGELSGEAVDFHEAIERFRQASETGCNDPGFWCDFGDAYCELGHLIARLELIKEGSGYYTKATEVDPESVEAWLNLGCAVGRLYEEELSDDDFSIAYNAFQKVTTLDASRFLAWLQWGRLLVSAGKINRDPSLFKLAVERFEKAHALAPDDPILLRQWAEACILWGSYMDRLDLIREGEALIHKSLRQQPHDPDAWYVLGTCLSELARYFNDEAYYIEAIDKFEFGLKQDPKSLPLWYGLALAHYGLGEITNDLEQLRQSSSLCERVMELGGDIVPQYWNDWGVGLMKIAELTNNKTYIEQAIRKFEKAISLVPEDETDPEWTYNLGCALDFLGDFSNDDKIYQKAIKHLRDVLEQDPEYIPANYNLALALSHLGELTGEPECFDEAIGYFEALIDFEDEDDLLYSEWGLALMNLGQLRADPHLPEKALRYYEEAESKLMHAVSLGSVSAFYHLACLYALTEKKEQVFHFLHKAQRAGALPAVEELIADEWLQSVRDTDAFESFVEELLDQEEEELSE